MCIDLALNIIQGDSNGKKALAISLFTVNRNGLIRHNNWRLENPKYASQTLSTNSRDRQRLYQATHHATRIIIKPRRNLKNTNNNHKKA